MNPKFRMENLNCGLMTFQRRYGMDIELKCVDKYEHLRAILTDQVEEPEDFEEALENSGFSVADFPRLVIYNFDLICNLFLNIDHVDSMYNTGC